MTTKTKAASKKIDLMTAADAPTKKRGGAKSTAEKERANSTPSGNLANLVVPKSYRWLIAVFIVVVIVLAGIVIHFSFAKAIIIIDPEYSEHDISFSAQIVDPNQSNLDLDQEDFLLGRKLNAVISQTKTFTVADQTVLSDQASGTVTIINNYTKDQTLIATTRLLSPDDKLFRLTETVTVPAGGQIEVLARADQPGDEYLLAPTTFIIPGLWEGLQDKIYGQSANAMAYQEEIRHELTSEQINQAEAEIRQEITETALEQFSSQITTNEFVNRDALIIEEIRHNISASAGADISQFDIELELSITTITYDEQKLLAKIENDINVLSEQNQGLIDFSSNDITMAIKENEDTSNGIIGVIQGKYKIKLANPDIDLSQIKGQDKDTALAYLSSVSGIKSVSLQLWPFWIKSIPTLDNHIEIRLTK